MRGSWHPAVAPVGRSRRLEGSWYGTPWPRSSPCRGPRRSVPPPEKILVRCGPGALTALGMILARTLRPGCFPSAPWRCAPACGTGPAHPGSRLAALRAVFGGCQPGCDPLSRGSASRGFVAPIGWCKPGRPRQGTTPHVTKKHRNHRRIRDVRGDPRQAETGGEERTRAAACRDPPRLRDRHTRATCTGETGAWPAG